MKIGGLEISRARKGQAETPAPSTGEVSILFSRLYTKLERWNPDALIARRGRDIYRKMLTDDQVRAVQTFLKHATLARGFQWTIDPDAPEAKTQAEFVAWAEAMAAAMRGTFTDKLFALQSAHDYGFAIMEKVYSPWEWRGRWWWAVVDLKLRPSDTFTFDGDEHGNIESLKQTVDTNAITIAREKVIHFVNRPDVDPHFGQSDLRDVYRAWWSKDTVIKLMNLYLERMAGGFVTAELGEGVSLAPAERTNLENVLQNLQGGTGIIFPPGVKGNFVFPSDTDAYERAISIYDKAISKALLMPNLLGLSEQGNVGSYSQSQTQFELFLFLIDARAARLADAMVEQMWAPIAEWNFGLRELPRWGPGPLTPSQKMELAKTWGQLAQNKVVIPDEGAEAHVRELLAFPSRPKGAKSIGMEMLPAVQPGGGFPPRPGAGAGGTPPREPKTEGGEGDGGKGGEASAEEDAETQRGRQYANAPPWVVRADFAAIDSATRDLEDRLAGDLGEVTLAIGDWLLAEVASKRLGTAAGGADGITSLNIPSRFLTALRRELRRGLEAGWRTGQRQAGSELKAAGWKTQTAFANPSGLTGSNSVVPGPGLDRDAAEEFLRARSYFGVQGLQQDMLQAVQAVLFNGMKYDFTTDQIAEKLGEVLRPFIPEVDAAGRRVNMAARLQTIARTNTFEAVNESRLNFFRDPELDGFVEGLEYSSILDGRTTELCTGLDGFQAALNDPVWDGLRPPNHYNCRSLLLPLTLNDKWTPGENPATRGLKPAPGFEGRPDERLGKSGGMLGKSAAPKPKAADLPPPKAWVPAQTMAQATKQAAELFPETAFGFQGLTANALGNVNALMTQLTALEMRLPGAVKNLGYLGTYKDEAGRALVKRIGRPGNPFRWSKDVPAHAWNNQGKAMSPLNTMELQRGKTVIGLNPKYMNNPELAQLAAGDFRLGYHVGQRLDSALTHEMGHAFQHLTEFTLDETGGFPTLGLPRRVRLRMKSGQSVAWDGRAQTLHELFGREVLIPLRAEKWSAADFGGSEDALRAFIQASGQEFGQGATAYKLSGYALDSSTSPFNEAFAEAFTAAMEIGQPGAKFASLPGSPEIVQRMTRWVEFWRDRALNPQYTVPSAGMDLKASDPEAAGILRAVQAMLDAAGFKGIAKAEAMLD